MKKSFTIFILVTFLCFIPGWNVTNAQSPLNFEGSIMYNPALVHGGSGSWEESILLPYAFIHDGTFYLFYTGLNSSYVASIGLATSSDGYSFTKYTGNPVLSPSGSGFDAINVSQGIVIADSSGWVMYYNATGYGPGSYIGRAAATNLTGPWTRSADPILTTGGAGEWDSELISPNNVFSLETGEFVMFYYAGNSLSYGVGYQIGMAISPDGLSWTKYDDPSTTNPPYAESDPVLELGEPGAWDDAGVWTCSVLKNPGGFEMYYSATGAGNFFAAFGYASSPDGISWIKYAKNPVYTIIDNDPYAVMMAYSVIEQPSVIIDDSTAFIYYDYGPPVGEIGMATYSNVGINKKKIVDNGLRITNYPNPVSQSTTFSYTFKEPMHVTIRVFNSFGQIVAEPFNETQTVGEQKVTWDSGNLPAGIYFYLIQAGTEAGGGKMVVVK